MAQPELGPMYDIVASLLVVGAVIGSGILYHKSRRYTERQDNPEKSGRRVTIPPRIMPGGPDDTHPGTHL